MMAGSEFEFRIYGRLKEIIEKNMRYIADTTLRMGYKKRESLRFLNRV